MTVRPTRPARPVRTDGPVYILRRESLADSYSLIDLLGIACWMGLPRITVIISKLYLW
jgi:hypothetical protein